MVFQNIFTTAQQAARSGTTAEDGISAYIPTRPTCVAPHDPMDPQAAENARGPHDPKIVRETAPEAQYTLDLISALTGTTEQAAERQNTFASDPSSTVNAASPIMHQGHQTTKKATDDLPPPQRSQESDTQ